MAGAIIWKLFLAAIIAGGFFLLQYLISKGKWIGDGDIMLGLFMGFALGWPNILLGLLLSYLVGAACGIILVIKDRKNLKQQIPFGPFLVIGTLVTLFFGDKIVSWYLSLL